MSLNLFKKFTQIILVRNVYLFIRTINKFGLLKGNQVYFSLKKNFISSELIKIDLPGYLDRILLRANSSDIDVFETVFIAERFKIKNDIDNPKVIVDAGANTGLVSIYFAVRFPNAKIYAIEPEESNYEIMEINTGNYQNIFPIKAGLWKDNTPLYLENPNVEKWAFRVTDEYSPNNSVKSIAVSDILLLSSEENIDIFKIDVEGAEKVIFSENYHLWIDKVFLFIIETHDNLINGCDSAFYSALRNLEIEKEIRGQNQFVWVVGKNY